MDLFWPLLTLRWLHLWSLLVLFGSALFAIYGLPRPQPPASCSPALGSIDRWLAALALAAGVSCVMLAMLEVTEEVGGLLSAAPWLTFFLETGLGRIWLLRLAGLGALLLYTWRGPKRQRHYHAAVAGLCAGLLATLAWLGHAVSAEGAEGFAGIFAYGCHVLAAGAWLGGLLPLSIALAKARAGGDRRCLCASLEGFSRMAMAAVALLLASGLVSAGLNTAGFADLGRTTYSWVLAGKIALFAVLMAMAAANRWVFLRRLRRQAHASPIHALSHSVLLEQLIGIAVVALAVGLSSLAPSG
jgi:copper resistance protein D